MSGEPKTVARNKRARHDYHIVDAVEAGIVLKGTEVKSVRLGKIQLVDGYARIEAGEVFLHGAHISPYEYGNRFNVDPLRRRKLLLHKTEIRRLHLYRIHTHHYDRRHAASWLHGDRHRTAWSSD